MKTIHLLLFSIIFLLFYSCSSEKGNKFVIKVNDFPVKSGLKAKVVDIPPVAITPFNLFITKEKLVMFNMKKDTIFDVFKLPECGYLFAAGGKGEGPDDFFDIDRRSFIPTDKGFKVFFQGHKALKEVEIHENTVEIVQEKTLKFDIDQYPVNGFTLINDTSYIYWSGLKTETEYDLLNTKTQERKSFSPYPGWCKSELKEDKMFTYVKNVTVKPNGKMFAAFYGYFKKFRIYDCQGNLLKDVSVEINPYDESLNKENRTIFYFSYPKSSDKYIYALCKNADNQTMVNPELQIWRWDGTPVGCYSLDRQISLFAVSEEYGKIYAINGDIEDEIYIYDLPKDL